MMSLSPIGGTISAGMGVNLYSVFFGPGRHVIDFENSNKIFEGDLELNKLNGCYCLEGEELDSLSEIPISLVDRYEELDIGANGMDTRCLRWNEVLPLPSLVHVRR
jgi:hypothetical protein